MAEVQCALLGCALYLSHCVSFHQIDSLAGPWRFPPDSVFSAASTSRLPCSDALPATPAPAVVTVHPPAEDQQRTPLV